MALWIADDVGNEVFEFADPTDLTAFVQRNLPATLSSRHKACRLTAKGTCGSRIPPATNL